MYDVLVEKDTVDVVDNVFVGDRDCELVAVEDTQYDDETVADCVMLDVTPIDHDFIADPVAHDAVCEFDIEIEADGVYDGENEAETDAVGVIEMLEEVDPDTV